MPLLGVQTCARSEEHTSELQSHSHLVCRLLLEKKKPLFLGRRLRDLGGAVRLHLHQTAQLQACFFFNDPAPPEIYTLPLPDALPIGSTTWRAPSWRASRPAPSWRGHRQRDVR